jgi:hypothetical protein
MAQISGMVTLNGISDQQLATIMEIKAKHPQMTFNPQAIQPFNETVSGGVRQSYNNVQFGFSKPDDIKAVMEILTKLAP